jgi:hypothetical protein
MKLFKKLTCHATFGCLLSSIYCVNGDGSNSYLSNGISSIAIGSHGSHLNLTSGCALLLG